MALYGGIMSGTSLDGVDAVLADLDEPSLRPRQVLAHVHLGFDDHLRGELLALNTSGPDELHRAALATTSLMGIYADAVARLLRSAGSTPDRVVAVGAHGQTVRHRPQEFGGPGYTIQLANGSLLAEACGISVVCDFRTADLAAGGQGAPLVPAFHAAMWSDPNRDVGLLNLGGIANLTLLSADGTVRGFDTGPGNLLMDLWCRHAFGRPFDDGGHLAASGQVDAQLLDRLLGDAYFAMPPPKSTGRDRFDWPWLLARLDSRVADHPIDVMATLAELTARSAADALTMHGPAIERLQVCGGGARNSHLMARLQRLLPTADVRPTDAAGMPADQVEALAFAWLAACRVEGRTASLPSVTGARAARVLGALYAAPRPQQPRATIRP